MKNKKWAIKMFVLSFFLSILFSMISQSMFPTLSAVGSLFVIGFFIVVSVVFDMIGVGITAVHEENLAKYKHKNSFGLAVKLCKNKEKIASFCADVVGDICGILSGAGGVSLMLHLHITDPNILFLCTCLISSTIAGLTIFGKAWMKTYALKNCELVTLKAAAFFDIFSFKALKNRLKNPKIFAWRTKNKKNIKK